MSLLLNTDQQDAAKSNFGYQNIRIANADEISERSVFGTPVWMSLEVEPFSYKLGGILYKVPGLIIPCAIVEISRPKVISETQPVGSKIQGTIKEYIGLGEWEINIKGIVANDKDSTYPEDKVNALAKIASVPVAVPINHRLLYRLGIYKMVIKTESYPSKQGFENMQAFEWSCVGDADVFLRLKHTKNTKPL